MIAVIGDFDATNPTHRATTSALEDLFGPGRLEWVGTDVLTSRRSDVARARGFLIAPGSPYRDMDAVVEVIRAAREEGTPLVGT